MIVGQIDRQDSGTGLTSNSRVQRQLSGHGRSRKTPEKGAKEVYSQVQCILDAMFLFYDTKMLGVGTCVIFKDSLMVSHITCCVNICHYTGYQIL